jgi:hypothetical protein
MADDPPRTTITLPTADWPTIMAGLYELPMKFAAPVAARLQEALAEAQKPLDVTRLREGKS